MPPQSMQDEVHGNTKTNILFTIVTLNKNACFHHCWNWLVILPCCMFTKVPDIWQVSMPSSLRWQILKSAAILVLTSLKVTQIVKENSTAYAPEHGLAYARNALEAMNRYTENILPYWVAQHPASQYWTALSFGRSSPRTIDVQGGSRGEFDINLHLLFLWDQKHTVKIFPSHIFECKITLCKQPDWHNFQCYYII